MQPAEVLDVDAHEAHGISWSERDELEVLTFELSGEVLAIEAIRVFEILDVLVDTIVPGAQPLVDRIVNFRGKIIPVADLRLAFGMERTERTVDSRIVVIELVLDGEVTMLGLWADRVLEVTTFARSECEEPPMVGMRWKREYVRCLARRPTGVTIVPDLKTIFESVLLDKTLN
ncbi:chemotaxis protein CheW [Aurantiacibacter suaedae]|uniref:chemotaxis protein CheW n=1 Tax=Aurantiacibacter suaedae TaxID=2545755 RepID=UPI0010F81B9C|nr:chemotaxis protein CheW [Aurantiacibacter suaedae]